MKSGRKFNFMIAVHQGEEQQFAEFLKTRGVLHENGPVDAHCKFPPEIHDRVNELWTPMKGILQNYLPDKMIRSLLDFGNYSDTRKIMLFAAVATRLLSRYSWLRRRLPLTWSMNSEFIELLRRLASYKDLPWKDRIKEFWGLARMNDDVLDQLIRLTCDIHAKLWEFSCKEPEAGWLTIFAQDLMLFEFFLTWGRDAIYTHN